MVVTFKCVLIIAMGTVSVLGQDEGYTVKYGPSPEGAPKGAT